MKENGKTRILGITGQVGSGKSTLAKLICPDASYIVDADQIARKIVNDSKDIQQKIRHTFGDEYFDEKGRLKRRDLGRRVFSNPESLMKLNHLIWPEMVRKIRDDIHQLKLKNIPLIVLDMAVLFETNLDNLCNYIVSVITPDDVRIMRLQKERDWSAEEMFERQKNQKSRDFLKNNSDIVVCNDGSFNDLKMKAESILNTLNIEGNGVC